MNGQDRNALYLMLNNVAGAASGVVTWFLFTRLAGLAASEVGLGYATIALGTTVGVVAKGGLDTALVRHVPTADRASAARLLRFGSLVGVGAAFALALGAWLVSGAASFVPHLTTAAWLFVGLIGALLVVTWMQDAYFVAKGDARLSFERNLVLYGTRIALVFPILAVARAAAIPLVWTLSLAASAFAAAWFARRLAHGAGRAVARREFLRSAVRNVTGNAAELLPGLLLVPLVLAVDGAASAAYFGIAWTAASILFLASAAIARSVLAELSRGGPDVGSRVIRRAARFHLWTVAPAALALGALAPVLLSIFGHDYARGGAGPLVVLSASVVVVAPAYLYLAILRARERTLALVAFPLAMILALALLSPPLVARWGLTGVAWAWFIANVPFGLYACGKLAREAREVNPLAPPAPFGRGPHVE